jgi:hypothetical protein
MKKFTSYFIISLFCNVTVIAQTVEFPPMDKSPMDMSYYPAGYPALKIQNKATEPLAARIIYSRPQKGGRVIFGGLVEYGKVWRLGANEATEIEFYKHVRVGGKRIPKGRYTLYAIPYEDKWTIILNKETDIWGAFKYDSKKDIIRTDAPVQKNNEPLEALAIVFEKSVDGINLVIGWDTVKVSLPIIL